jgi:protein-tyrosine phosphatase
VQVTLPDGTSVVARGRVGLVPADRDGSPDYALYLDGRWSSDADVTWPHRVILWEDFGTPADEQALFASVKDVYRRAQGGELVEIGCYGGLGRTGTVLACLATLTGLTATDAVAWVRAHYHPAAIETAAQEELVQRFAATL